MTSSGGPASSEKGKPAGDADEGEKSFGVWLRRQRELREISLREIADTSKISLRYLEALEEERFDLLPAQIFAKGFLRQYARYVGIDPEEAVNFFLATSQPVEEPIEIVEVRERPRRKPFAGWAYVAVAVAAALLLLLLVWGLTRLNDEARGEPEPSAGSGSPAVGEGAVDNAFEDPTAGKGGARGDTGSATPATPAGSEAGETAEATSAEMAAAGAATGGGDSGLAVNGEAVNGEAVGGQLVVTVDFHRDCWVEAAVDGTRRVAEIRVQGESLRLQAQELVEIKLGDAGAVDVEVNGRPMALEAESGAVQTLRIDRETARRLASSS